MAVYITYGSKSVDTTPKIFESKFTEDLVHCHRGSPTFKVSLLILQSLNILNRKSFSYTTLTRLKGKSIITTKLKQGNTMNIYIAGSLFSLAEKCFNKSIANEIRKAILDCTVLLPQEFSKEINEATKEAQVVEIFNLCIQNIDKSDVVLAILDGSDVDSGTCVELGYAYSKKKHIIGIRTDYRSLEDKVVNLMVSNVCNELITDVDTEDIITLSDKIINSLTKYQEVLTKKPLFVFISGPYMPSHPNNPSEKTELINKNVETANKIALEIANKGHYPFVPHTMMKNWEDENHITRTKALEICHKWLEKCDAMYFIAKSEGSQLERQRADGLKLQIFDKEEDIPNINLNIT